MRKKSLLVFLLTAGAALAAQARPSAELQPSDSWKARDPLVQEAACVYIYWPRAYTGIINGFVMKYGLNDEALIKARTGLTTGLEAMVIVRDSLPRPELPQPHKRALSEVMLELRGMNAVAEIQARVLDCKKIGEAAVKRLPPLTDSQAQVLERKGIALFGKMVARALDPDQL